MKRLLFLTLLVSGSLSATACSAAVNQLSSAAGGGNYTSVSQLWSDVPRMDGLTDSNQDLPLPMKLVMRTVLGNLGKLNGPGEDQTTGNVDWIVFTTAKTPDDVKNFYTNDRMTGFGQWEPGKNSTCLNGSDQGISQVGVLCLFQKEQNSTLVQLVILSTQDDSTKQTNVFFLRLESNVTPVANKAPTTGNKPARTKGAITMLGGTAPYGIDKRPMPQGLNLDQLLPKQVGPYTRALLEKSEQRGVQPTSIEVDGNGVYATYRAGGQ